MTAPRAPRPMSNGELRLLLVDVDRAALDPEAREVFDDLDGELALAHEAATANRLLLALAHNPPAALSGTPPRKELAMSHDDVPTASWTGGVTGPAPRAEDGTRADVANYIAEHPHLTQGSRTRVAAPRPHERAAARRAQEQAAAPPSPAPRPTIPEGYDAQGYKLDEWGVRRPDPRLDDPMWAAARPRAETHAEVARAQRDRRPRRGLTHDDLHGER